MKLTPERRIYALGGILLLALTICCRNFGDRGGPGFMASITVAGVTYLLAIRELFATERLARRVVIIGLVLSGVWQIEFLRTPAGFDDDIHRYVWDGRLQRLGYNPYLIVPSDPAVQRLHTTETRSLNNPNLATPYPPGAQLFFRVVTGIHESVHALKIAFGLCSWGIVFLLVDLLRSERKSAHLLLAYAWNPLLAIEGVGSGHIDIVGALLLVLSVVALVRGWRSTAAVALALAIAVKFLPIALLPLYWKRIRIRDAALATCLIALLYVPFLRHGFSTGSLAAYVQGFRFNGPLFAALNHFVPAQLLAAGAICAGLLTALIIRRRAEQVSLDNFAWPMAASLLCAPVVFPWYLLWLLPCLISRSTTLIAVWTVSIIPTYVMWHFRTLGRGWGALPVWVMLLEYGTIAIFAIVLLARQISRLPPKPNTKV